MSGASQATPFQMAMIHRTFSGREFRQNLSDLIRRRCTGRHFTNRDSSGITPREHDSRCFTTHPRRRG